MAIWSSEKPALFDDEQICHTPHDRCPLAQILLGDRILEFVDQGLRRRGMAAVATSAQNFAHAAALGDVATLCGIFCYSWDKERIESKLRCWARPLD